MAKKEVVACPSTIVGVQGTAPKWSVFVQHEGKTYAQKDLDRFEVEYYFKQLVNGLIGQLPLDTLLEEHSFKPAKLSGSTKRVIGLHPEWEAFYHGTLSDGKLALEAAQCEGPRWLIAQSLMIHIGKVFDWNDYEDPKE